MPVLGQLWELFITFFMIGFVSFGGGYAMIPVIKEEVVYNHSWMTAQAFTDVIAVAGMSPGPIATNTSIFVGYQIAKLPGAIVSALGMTLPSLIIILIVASFFYKVYKSVWVKSAFYGLRPIITGLIFYAALTFAYENGLVSSFSWHTVSLLAIYAVALFALIKLKTHPIVVILASGLVGIAFYG